MKLVCDVSDSKRNSLAQQPIFGRMTDFLHRNQQVILRELVKEFPQAGFAKYLESCIEAGLILRKDRRYQLALPVFSGKEQTTLLSTKAAQAFLQSGKTKNAAELSLLFEAARRRATRGFDPYYLEADVELLRFAHLEDEALILASASVGDLQAEDLAGYFSANRRVVEPSVFAKMRRLLGDVDEDYFMQQIGWIVSRITRGKVPRQTIFLETLLSTGIVAKTAEGLFTMEIPCLVKGDVTGQSTLSDKTTAKSHFEEMSLYSELCKDCCGGLQQWFVKIK